MKIYDCFMFFDEEMLLDLRLNILNSYVDKFVITESKFMHSGKPKKLIFDINKFSKFKDKIIYIVADQKPPDLLKINEEDNINLKNSKKIKNAYKREIFQVEKIQSGIDKANDEDIIIVSDLDEIPNLENINFKNIKQKLIFFKQKMYYYKLNLLNKSLSWYGSKASTKKNFKSPQWLRTIKNKKYPIWRIDTYFSTRKYNDIFFVENGGWHFTNIRTPEDLEKKLLNFLHHVDYENSKLKLENLKQLMKEKKIMYNHSVDQRNFKWSGGEKLEKVKLNTLPSYILENIEKYKPWLDN